MLKEIFEISEGILRFAIYVSILVAGCAIGLLGAYVAVYLCYRIGQAISDFIDLIFGISPESLIWITQLNM